ncbi:hypothetical protein VTN49DRAFT_1006 [Thermomyces lanuginosus]|uniref:uncharacterized protein n=1 Tax=Thermomyces lanuginosus TaxID=5541 RepID=UPI0037444AA3
MFFFFSFLISSLVPSASSGLTLYGRSGRSAPLCYTNSFSRKKSTRIRHLYISPFSTLLYLLLGFGIPDGSAQRRILLLSERQRVHFFSLHLTILRHLDVRFIREFLSTEFFFCFQCMPLVFGSSCGFGLASWFLSAEVGLCDVCFLDILDLFTSGCNWGG